MSSDWIDVREAWREIEGQVQTLPSERVGLAQAVGRVLAQPVRTDRTYPPFDRAAMDGFAVRAADVESASHESPVSLPVVGESTPGREPDDSVAPGTAIRIMTGAAVPPGCDAIVPVESTSGFGSDRVRVVSPSAPGRHIARCGVERAADDLLFDAGHRLRAADVGALAMVGATQVEVARRPRAAVLSTGNELVPVDHTPERTQIRNSNGPMLIALAAAEAEVESIGVAADSRRDLGAAVSRGLMYDLLLVTGGVSMGAYDLVGGCLAAAGVRVHFDRVALQPGKPLLFGTHPAGAALALPGNPVSALTTFRLFGVPLLRRLQGVRRVRPVWARALARFDWERRSPKKWILLPGRRVAGGAEVERVPYSGSGDLLAYAQADCQIVLPPTLETVSPGTPVDVWSL
ncbi:MAG: molybdopterin molybdotransferase MoeA [Candidatus Latescibacterota bacterium]|nr:MAG: molybdopterin molybdotransferase MoeA [Candidatus Latescibacterota bacterium]